MLLIVFSPFYYNKLVEDFKNDSVSILSDSMKPHYLHYGKLFSTTYKNTPELNSKYLKFIK